jgi:hypothetical protein
MRIVKKSARKPVFMVTETKYFGQTDMGKGQELERALTKEKNKNLLWAWLGTP